MKEQIAEHLDDHAAHRGWRDLCRPLQLQIALLQNALDRLDQHLGVHRFDEQRSGLERSSALADPGIALSGEEQDRQV